MKIIQILFADSNKSRTFAPTKHRGVEQLVARWAHNPKVIRSSRISATKDKKNRRNAVLLFMTTLLYWFYWLSLKPWGIALKFLFCIMKTSSSQTIDPVASLSLFLPSGILDYFTLVNHVSQDTCFILYLEEKATIPAEYSDLHLHSKGFLPEIEVQDFPIRGKAVYLRIKRRRWEDPSTGQTYSRDWSLVATGTRITAEFGAF